MIVRDAPVGVEAFAGQGVVSRSVGAAWDDLLATAPELEELGYSTIWVSGGALTELGQVADLARLTRNVAAGFAQQTGAGRPRTADARPGSRTHGWGAAHPRDPRVHLAGLVPARPDAVQCCTCL